MNKNVIMILAALSLSGIACAQDSSPIGGFTVRGGFSYLTDSSAARLSSAYGYSLGVGWDLKTRSSSWMGVLSLDLDYAIHSANSEHLESFGLQLVARQPFAKYSLASSEPHFYYGAGLGVFRVKADNEFVGPGGVLYTATDSKYVLGGMLLVGMAFTKNTDLELSYRVRGNVNGVKADTLNFTVGYHF